MAMVIISQPYVNLMESAKKIPHFFSKNIVKIFEVLTLYKTLVGSKKACTIPFILYKQISITGIFCFSFLVLFFNNPHHSPFTTS